ncbi:MAG: rhamnulokinase [Bacteroidales bacterium]|jgi:rhamnulokinase|nr:rhamnulokinase [Bacteroidales bacterium]
MKLHTFIAFDLGATSGRAIVGTLSDGKIMMEEVARFANGMIGVGEHLHWNILGIYDVLKNSLKTYALSGKPAPESIGIDTWGVDFGLLAADGSLLGEPYAYRDLHTNGIMEEYFKLLPREKVYELTGIQFMQFNSLFQLFAMKRNRSSLLESAKDLLFLPDLLNYLFTGVKKAEFTIASTSQMLNPKTMDWAKELFDIFDAPVSLMQPLVLPGTVTGYLTESVQRETGIGRIPVVAVGAHDTASAIAAVPAEGENWAYLSSGTWSLMGIETKKPLIDKETEKMNFTNEGGIEGTFRFLKNITGMWLLEQCRKEWASEKDYAYGELVEMAKAEKPFTCFVDPDAPDFMNPESMTTAIKGYCQRSNQSVPSSTGGVVRCIFESLALKYRYTLEQLQRVSPHPIEKLHVIGGGAKNAYLCQMTANAIRMPVVAGPAEGTAMGNLLVQAMALGYLKSLSDIRQVVRNSVETQDFYPQDAGEWDQAYLRYKNVIAAG